MKNIQKLCDKIGGYEGLLYELRMAVESGRRPSAMYWLSQLANKVMDVLIEEVVMDSRKESLKQYPNPRLDNQRKRR